MLCIYASCVERKRDRDLEREGMLNKTHVSTYYSDIYPPKIKASHAKKEKFL